MISGDLEYLMTSLPYLTFNASEESKKAVSDCLRKYSDQGMGDLTLDRLLDIEAAKYLSRQRTNFFKEITLDQLHKDNLVNSDLPLLAGFSRYVAGLRDELKILRIARREADDPIAIERLPSPIKTGNPLEEEIRILELQWDRIEALSSMHFSNFSALVAYKLKLMLLLRLWSFDQNKGYEIFVKTTNLQS